MFYCISYQGVVKCFHNKKVHAFCYEISQTQVSAKKTIDVPILQTRQKKEENKL